MTLPTLLSDCLINENKNFIKEYCNLLQTHIQMHGETDTFNLFINPINQNFEYYLQKWHIRKQQCFSKQTSFQEKIQILIP